MLYAYVKLGGENIHRTREIRTSGAETSISVERALPPGASPPQAAPTLPTFVRLNFHPAEVQATPSNNMFCMIIYDP